MSKNENRDISPLRYLCKSIDINTRVTLPDGGFDNFCLVLTVTSISQQTGKNSVGD